MIVADTNLLVYLHVPGDRTALAEAVRRAEPVWAAPHLWRSEFRSVLGGYLRRRLISRAEALTAFGDACSSLGGGEHPVDAGLVFGLVESSGCSSYDCEFVALALEHGVPLVTSDARILREFPGTAVPMAQFA